MLLALLTAIVMVASLALPLSASAAAPTQIIEIIFDIESLSELAISGGWASLKAAEQLKVGDTTYTVPSTLDLTEAYSLAGWIIDVTDGDNTETVTSGTVDVADYSTWDDDLSITVTPILAEHVVIKYDVNDSLITGVSPTSISKTTSLADDNEVVLQSGPTSTSHNFAGWMIDGYIFEDGTSFTGTLGNVYTAEAQWTEKDKFGEIITTVGEAGAAFANTTGLDGLHTGTYSFTLENDVASGNLRPGYELKSWIVNGVAMAKGDTVSASVTGDGEAVTVAAVIEGTVTVNYTSSQGTAPSDDTEKFIVGTDSTVSVTMPAKPAVTTHAFGGWLIDGEIVAAGANVTLATDSLEYEAVAQWSDEVEISFDVDGTVTKKTVKIGTVLDTVTPTAADTESKKFLGWHINWTNSDEPDLSTVNAPNPDGYSSGYTFIVTANYEDKDKYTIEYKTLRPAKGMPTDTIVYVDSNTGNTAKLSKTLPNLYPAQVGSYLMGWKLSPELQAANTIPTTGFNASGVHTATGYHKDGYYIPGATIKLPDYTENVTYYVTAVWHIPGYITPTANEFYMINSQRPVNTPSTGTVTGSTPSYLPSMNIPYIPRTGANMVNMYLALAALAAGVGTLSIKRKQK